MDFRIFQPRYFGDEARAIIADIEGEDEHWDPRHFGNLTFGQSRKKRATTVHRMSRRQMEQEAKRQYREYKTKHRL